MPDEIVDGEQLAASKDADMSQIDVFHFKDDCVNFESLGRENGYRHWMATDLAKCLGYDDYSTFRNAINKAMVSCASLNIPVDENFSAATREVDGIKVQDFKLSRFACYITAMNGDTRKPKVAAAQAYFAVMAESFRQYLEDANDIERLTVRGEITDREKSLSGVAKSAGVDNYPFFQNAGYRGMYNMNIGQLKAFKHTPDAKKSLLDYMGKEELAANLFRLTQTESRIKNQGIRGQTPCENAAESVGRSVRATMIATGGSKPENLPLEADIGTTKKNIKQTHKGFKKLGSAPKSLPK